MGGGADAMKLAVVGLGKLGSPLAAVLASAGHEVVGVDMNPELVAAVNAGRPPVQEPDLAEVMSNAGGRLRATTNYRDAIPGSEVSFVIVPTPSDRRGLFSNQWVVRAAAEIGEVLKETDHYHVVNVTSTVMPGSTGGEIRAALEAASGRKVGVDVGLTYNPEFIALGSVVRDLLRPDMLLIGESDRRAGDRLEAVYRAFLDERTPVQRMNWVNAEIAKISVNTFVTTKISYANMLAELCEKIPEADVDVVTEALGKDTRIGPKYLKGGLGYGGPCFPRDNVAWAALARSLGSAAELAEATDAVNRRQSERMVSLVCRLAPKGGSVAVLGLAYKPNTPVIEESQGLEIAKRLGENGFAVVAHDATAAEAASLALGDRIRVVADANEAIRFADAIVVATPAVEYASLTPDSFARAGQRRIVVDCWRVLPSEIDDVAEVYDIGRNIGVIS